MSNRVLLLAYISVVLCLSFMSCNKDSPSEPGSTLAQKLQNELDNALEASNGMGVSAAVLIPGKDPWLGVSGVSHETTSITSDMMFSIGSTTKNFTAALIL